MRNQKVDNRCEIGRGGYFPVWILNDRPCIKRAKTSTPTRPHVLHLITYKCLPVSAKVSMLVLFIIIDL